MATVCGFINVSYSVVMSLGTRDRILIIRTIEIPFPTPFLCNSLTNPHQECGTCSQRYNNCDNVHGCHIRNKSLTAKSDNHGDTFQQSQTYGHITCDSCQFFLPSSPSFCISSSFGIAIVRSSIMMDDVM